MPTLFALIILLQGAADGGRAINTELRFQRTVNMKTGANAYSEGCAAT